MDFKIGDKVLFKKKCISMHCERLIDWYALPIAKTMPDSSFLQCHFWLNAELFGEQPVSKVVGFGEDKPNEPTVRVRTKYKGISFDHYYDPKHLNKIER